MLKDEIKKNQLKKGHKNDLGQFELTNRTRDPGHETEITS
jgi:hypothetical protein